jgi:paraquat-inducible protein B
MRARPAIVGGFILGALGLGVAAILFFGGVQLFATTSRVVVFFDESVAGLEIGAPVTFHGVRIGSVQNIAIQFSTSTMTARIPVFLELHSKQITWEGKKLGGSVADYERLVQAGLRAQLALQSVLTGQLRVDLEFRPGTPARLVGTEPSVPEIPSVPSELGRLRNQLTNLPLRELSDAAQRALTSLGSLADHLDRKLDPLVDSAQRTADAATRTLQTTDQAVSRVQADASTTLGDLDSLLVDTRHQLDARGDELGRSRAYGVRSRSAPGRDLARLAQWTGGVALAVPRRPRSDRTRSRCQRQLPAQLRRNGRAQSKRPPHGAHQPMKRVWTRSSPRRWFFPAAILVFFDAAMFGLGACSMAGPPPAEYVLGTMPPARATATAVPQTGLPVVELKRVQLPVYLDTTDILERRGNQLIPSSTGRWGERLSVGMSRALTAALAARLPRVIVTATPPVERPARQVFVDVAAFEARAGHEVVLVARWSITDGAGRRILATDQTSLVEPIAGTGDSAVVAAMSHAVEDLADQVAARIESDR